MGHQKKVYLLKNNQQQEIPGNEQEDAYVDKQDIKQWMNISDRTLQTWRKEGILPFTKIGAKIYYRKSDLLLLLFNNTQLTTQSHRSKGAA